MITMITPRATSTDVNRLAAPCALAADATAGDAFIFPECSSKRYYSQIVRNRDKKHRIRVRQDMVTGFMLEARLALGV